jgi:DNA damage-binding protein 1
VIILLTFKLQGHSNLLTFRLKDQIEPAASFGLHEDVARFRQGGCGVHCVIVRDRHLPFSGLFKSTKKRHELKSFAPGSLAPPSSAPEVINPDLLFATTDGRLGVIGELTPAAARTMDELQRNMDRYWKGPGGISWKT